MMMNKKDKLTAIQATIDDFDRKIKRTNELIEETRQRKVSTEAFENQLAGYLRSREDMRAEWQKLADEVKAL